MIDSNIITILLLFINCCIIDTEIFDLNAIFSVYSY